MVAIAVIACSAVLLFALTVALSGFRFKKPSRTLQIDYADVTGIHLASELRYAGAPAGHVINIRLLTAEERNAAAAQNPVSIKNAVRITVEVNDAVPPIPADAAASIDSDTLLSEKFISLSAGTPNGNVLANNAVIQGNPNGLDLLLHGGGDLVAQIEGLLKNLEGPLKDLVPKLSDALDEAKKALTSGKEVLDNAKKLVADDGSVKKTLDEIHNAVTKLEGVEADLDDVLKKAGVLVGNTNQNIDGRMKELSVVLQNLKVTTTYLKAFSQQIAEKPNRIIFMGKATKLEEENNILKSGKPLPAKATPTPAPAQ